MHDYVLLFGPENSRRPKLTLENYRELEQGCLCFLCAFYFVEAFLFMLKNVPWLGLRVFISPLAQIKALLKTEAINSLSLFHFCLGPYEYSSPLLPAVSVSHGQLRSEK